MADSSFSLLSLLNAEYPSLPITIVLKVLKKYENDEQKCRQALDSEVEKRLNSPDGESSQASTAPKNTNSNNNLESPNDGRPLTPRNKDTLKTPESSPLQRPVTPERHVSTIEASIGNASRPLEQTKRPYGQSVSWNVQQPPDRPASAQPGRSANSSMNTPQSAPPDFTPFFVHTVKDIPNVNCSAPGFVPGLGGSAHFANRPQLMPSPPSSSGPVGEPRHPVKVINIPPGSLSGGSVYRAPAPSSSRHIHMHFGDTGGICTISSPPSTPQHYGSTPNVSQQYRSELRTDPSATHPIHSSSIVVDTSSHINNLIPERKISASSSGSDLTIGGRRTPNPPTSFKTSEISPGSGQTGIFPLGRLSAPVPASSPGISQSRPVFVEIKTDRMRGAYNDTNFTPGFYQVGNVRPPPSNLGYLPYQSGQFNAQSNLPNYNIQYGQDFPNHANTSLGHTQQEQMYPQNAHQLKLPGFSSPPANWNQPAANTSYSPSSYSQFNNPTNVMGYPLMYMPGHNSGISTSTLQHFTQYGQHPGHAAAISMPRSPSIGIGQLSLGSRSSSQDSEPSGPADFDPRHYSAMGSRVSSHGSLNSDSSSGRMDRGDTSTRPRSGSIQDDAEYIGALVQHQRSQVQKLLEEMNHYKVVLDKLRSEVSMMEKNKIEASNDNRSFPSAEDISKMCQNNRRLQTDIQLYMNEIDMYRSGQTPFDKINPRDQQNFFDNMPTGQQDPIYSRTPEDRSPSPRPIPPPRPPPPLPARQRSTDPVLASSGILSSSDISRVPPVPPAQPVINSGDSEEGESWNCSACTFSNHPALKKCEMCEMPRVVPQQPASVLSPFNPSSHQPLSSLPPRLAPGLVGNLHHRPASPHHHHHTG
ncbi:unnamed protein product, partial [Candidula unifasciata]